MKRVNQLGVFQVLDQYYEFGDAGTKRPTTAEILRNDTNGVSIPAGYLFRCEVGIALQRLQPWERFYLLKYYWALKTWERGSFAVGYAVKKTSQAGTYKHDKEAIKQLSDLMDVYLKEAQKQMAQISRNKQFKSSVEKMNDSLTRAFGPYWGK